jgi:hypothetical protein
VGFVKDVLELLVMTYVRLETLWALHREAEQCGLYRLKSQCQDFMARHPLQVKSARWHEHGPLDAT